MKKILIDCLRGGVIRIAVVVDGVLTEIIAEKLDTASSVGNIYAGIVKNILPSQFMFVDIGKKKNAFIHLSDSREILLINKKTNRPKIRTGDTLLVQIVKEAAGEKGAYATSVLSFTGLYLVVTKTGRSGEVGLSRKIEDNSERDRLKRCIRTNIPDGYDVIVRTRCEGCEEAEIIRELGELILLCEKAENEWKRIKAPALVYEDGMLMEKVVRELFTSDIDEILVNNSKHCAEVMQAAGNLNSEAEKLIKFYDEEGTKKPIFSLYDIEKKINKALQKKVWLNSGGFLVIEKTEACTVIDVNTGKFTGTKGHDESVLKINLEAADEIALQIRLRNISGIVIVDFIDMKTEENKRLLLSVLGDALKKDRMPATLCGMTELGLVLITRKKTRKPIAEVLATECKVCGGTGRIV